MARPSELSKHLQHYLQADIPVFIWGAPGVGKSDIVRQTADAMGFDGVIDIRASLFDPVDFRGVPQIVDGMTRWALPDFLPREGRWLLFLDELSAAPPSIQAALYQLILDRKLGDYTLPHDCRIIAAGNRALDKAVVHRQSSALTSRMAHIQLEADLGDFTNWCLRNNIDPMVQAFVRFRPELLHKMDKHDAGETFPCPRTWAMASRVLNTNPPEQLRYEMLAGVVGAGAAGEFIAFMRLANNAPSIDDIIKTPTTTPVPTDVGTLYAVAAALAHHATEHNFAQIILYTERMPSEYSVFIVKDALQRDGKLVYAPGFNRFAERNRNALLGIA